MIRWVHPVPARAAAGLVGTVYEEIRRDFGALVEPFTLHSPSPTLLAAAWRACRATLVTGSVPRVVKEVVATGVSASNRCPYCVDAHTVMLDGAGAHDAARALAADRAAAIGDPRLRAIAAWARASRDPASPLLATPPFAAAEAPEILGTALVFHYVNRPVSVLLGASPLPLATGALKPALRRGAGLWFGRAIRRPGGTAPPLLPDGALPDDLAWAQTSPAVGDALARFAAAVEVEGARVLSLRVRDTVVARVREWRGEDVGLGRHWMQPALDDVDRLDRAAAGLALLTALAPHQVDDDVVTAFRGRSPDDADLVAVVAWASLTAARRVLSWLARRP